MALEEYIPQHILTTENFGPKSVVTAEHWNELFNLLISQGNGSAHALANLINELGVVGVTELVRSADNRMRHVRLNNDGAIEVSSDNVTWEVTASSGHVILDKNNTILPQRLRLKFTNTTVTDIDGVTVVAGIKGDKGDKGDSGVRGEQGEQGIQGLPGSVGYVLTTTLTVADWVNVESIYSQTISLSGVDLTGYAYIVTPAMNNWLDYSNAQIRMETPTTTNQVRFWCTTVPTTAIAVNILKVRLDS